MCSSDLIKEFTDHFDAQLTVDVVIYTGYISLYLFHLLLALFLTLNISKDALLTMWIPLMLYLLGIYELGSSATVPARESRLLALAAESLSLGSAVNADLRLQIQVMVNKITIRPPDPSPKMYFTLNRSLLTSVRNETRAHVLRCNRLCFCVSFIF